MSSVMPTLVQFGLTVTMSAAVIAKGKQSSGMVIGPGQGSSSSRLGVPGGGRETTGISRSVSTPSLAHLSASHKSRHAQWTAHLDLAALFFAVESKDYEPHLCFSKETLNLSLNSNFHQNSNVVHCALGTTSQPQTTAWTADPRCSPSHSHFRTDQLWKNLIRRKLTFFQKDVSKPSRMVWLLSTRLRAWTVSVYTWRNYNIFNREVHVAIFYPRLFGQFLM